LLAPVLAQLQLSVIRCWLADASGVKVETLAETLTASTQRLLFGGA
jgi:hypothetical protein